MLDKLPINCFIKQYTDGKIHTTIPFDNVCKIDEVFEDHYNVYYGDKSYITMNNMSKLLYYFEWLDKE